MGMLRKLALLALLGIALVWAVPAASTAAATPISVYGAWHCGSDACIWGSVRDMIEFDTKNHWLIDRGDGVPSVNLVILSFVQPLKLLNTTTDTTTLNGIPRGMTQAVVNYFKSRNIRVNVLDWRHHLCRCLEPSSGC